MGGNNKRKNEGGGGSGGNKKGRTGKYLPGAFAIDPKMQGFLITCTRGKETPAGAEMIDLLTEYAEKLYGTNFTDSVQDEDEDEDESVEDAIAREVAQLKKPKSKKHFLYMGTGTDCVFFIRTLGVEPVELCKYLLTDLQKSKIKRTRYCARIVPVTETSYAIMPDIENMATRLFAPHFHEESGQPQRDFSILPKIRHNDKISRDTVIKTLAGKVGPPHKVNLINPRHMVLIEVIKSICFMSVVENYFEFKKFNLQSIFEEGQKDKESDTGNDKDENANAQIDKEKTQALVAPEEPAATEPSKESTTEIEQTAK